MSDESDFDAALDALPASPKLPTAAEVVRKKLKRLRQRKHDGVDELALLELVNRQAQSPITLITLRCYLSRGVGRTGLTIEPAEASPIAKREEPKTASLSRPGSGIRASSKPHEDQSARTEQRGITRSIKPGPVE